ncbi:MAG: hypothetical protein QOF13_2294 [Solirubrobacterales bacterium]|jgi:hypothetical protein|nr:hypothetical protein [Solirubrobacterales bacterium]
MHRRVLYIYAALALAGMLTACGSSGASQDELDQARTEGAAQAKQQGKIEGIEKQLKALKHGHASNGPNTSPPPGTPPATSGEGSSCGGGLSVGPNTTCGFAENVEADYFTEIGSGSGTVVSYSPTTGRLYSMYCTAGAPHECTGGNNASVYFP